MTFKEISNQLIHFDISRAHPAGTGLKKNFELKTQMLFYFEEHTSVILKNFKIEKSNGGFLRNLIKSQRKWLFFKKMSRMIILTHLIDQNARLYE